MFTLLHFIVNHYIFQPKWPSSSVAVVVPKETAVLLFYCDRLGLFLCRCRAVTLYVLGLWFHRFVDFSLVLCVAVLDVFLGAEVPCLAACYHGSSVSSVWPWSPAGSIQSTFMEAVYATVSVDLDVLLDRCQGKRCKTSYS